MAALLHVQNKNKSIKPESPSLIKYLIFAGNNSVICYAWKHLFLPQAHAFVNKMQCCKLPGLHARVSHKQKLKFIKNGTEKH